MKKVLSMVLVLMLAAVSLIGCTRQDLMEALDLAGVLKVELENADSGIVKLGLGHVNSIGSSKELAGEVLPMGQVDTVMAVVGFDQDGKVVKVSIDNAQTKVNFDKSLQLTSDLKAENKTKVEKGDEYGMIAASVIKKEWYQQIAELEKWMVGKTVSEIKALKVKEKDASHPAVPDAPELTSLVTISVQDYIAAVEEAYNTAVDVEGVTKVGLGHEVSIASSKSLDAAKNVLPLAQVDTVIAATAFDKDGKVVKTLIDTAQIKVQFDANGKITTDKSAVLKTKVEKGDAYGMIAASSIKKEWYQQIAELEKWMSGKTVSEIKALKVTPEDAAHAGAPDVPELTSLVTIGVQDYIAAVAESYDNAK